MLFHVKSRKLLMSFQSPLPINFPLEARTECAKRARKRRKPKKDV